MQQAPPTGCVDGSRGARDGCSDRSTAHLAIAVVTLLACLVVASGSGASTLPIRFDRISVEDGLSQSSVLSMLQDSKGFMWFGTEDGLNRFDGYDFRIYSHDPSNLGSLANDYIVALAEDGDGNLWIGTHAGGIARWLRASNSFETYRHDTADPSSLPSDRIRTLAVDSRGQLWVGTRNAGLAQFDEATKTFVRHRHDPSDPSSLSDDHVYAIAEDHSGAIWVGTDAGINLFNPENGTFVRYRSDSDDPQSLSDDRIRAMLIGRDDLVWIGTYGGGLNRFERSTGTFARYRHDANDRTSLSHDRVRSILEDSTGRLWVGTVEGLNLLHRDTGQFSRYMSDDTNPNSLPGNDVMALYQDRGDMLWVGTQAGGLGKWNPRSWSFGHYTVDPADSAGLNHKMVTSFTEDRSGRLWIGTFGGGVNVLDRTTGKVSHYRNDPTSTRGLASDRVMALLRDRADSIWIGTFDKGLNRFDQSTGTFSSYRHDPGDERTLSADGVMSLFEDSRGNLWVGTFRGGLDLYRRETDSFKNHPHDPEGLRGPASPRVTCIVEDTDGAIWVGTDGGGLSRFDPVSDTWMQFGHDASDPASLGADSVFSLHVDASGRLWIGTVGGGLVTLEGLSTTTGRARFRRYLVRDGLANDVVYGIESDGDAKLWLSTNRGLSQFDPRTGTFKTYTRSHGLQGDEFNFGAHFSSPSGALVFGGLNGFNIFFPGRLQRSTQPPQIRLTSVLKLNQPIEGRGPVGLLKSLDLGYRDDMITFEFAALDFTAPHENTYRYKLDGFNTDWVNIGSHHRVSFTNLDAGDYVFRVKAANADGVESTASVELPVSVEPAPWETWWAYTGYVMVILLSAAGIWRAQRNRLKMEANYSSHLKREVEEQTRVLADKNARLEDMNNMLLEASLTDSLTGLRNRRFLFEQVTKDIAMVRRRYLNLQEGVENIKIFDLAFLMIDLDHFKAINDSCGHQAGDQVLLEIRDVFLGVVRDSDIVIRWGGDEFLIIARDSDPEKAKTLADRIRTAVADSVFSLPDGQVVRTTCSIGFACYPFVRSHPDRITWEQVLTLADSALYEAKKSERNSWFGYLATDTSVEVRDLYSAVRDQPDELVAQGRLRIKSSTQQHSPADSVPTISNGRAPA
jgi:diguanylate cyclase (GGDEF)-like protein